MKALFVGLGSIGTRHLRNLSALCQTQNIPLETTALRHTAAQLAKDVTTLVHHQIQILPPHAQFDVAFITGPTHLHAAALQNLQGRVGAFFIEKPIFEATSYNLAALGLSSNQKAYVAAPMRWCGVYRALAQKIKETPVYAVRALCSSYLPEWRPNADYRKVYSAHAAMGGGVTLDLIHEWDYLQDLFGKPTACYSLSGKFSNLEIDSDDLALYIARYPGFLCELHLDYFGRLYRREIEIFSQQGSLLANFGTGQLHLPDGTTQDYAEPPNRRYEREMEYFIHYARQGNGESLNSPAQALETLKITLGEE